MRFAGKVVIVTGGAQGIGAGVVRVFYRNGAKVAIADIKEEVAQRTVAEVSATHVEGAEVVFFQCDLRKEEDIKNLIESTVAKFGRIDCLVNNAAFQARLKAIDDITAEEFTDYFRVNVLGGFLCDKYAMPYLRKTQGSIVNISSVSDSIAQAGASPYVMTKGAVSSLTRALAVDEAAHNVRVNAVCPGAIWTEMNETLARASNDYDSFRDNSDKLSLLGRCGLTEEVGEACLYLANEATFTTGTSLLVSGGTELGLGRKSRVGLAPTDRYCK